MLGCGNSRLSEEVAIIHDFITGTHGNVWRNDVFQMYDDGYENIVNIDARISITLEREWKADEHSVLWRCHQANVGKEPRTQQYDVWGYYHLFTLNTEIVICLTGLEMDVRKLQFESGSFDVCIDKGTMDAMMTSKGDVWVHY